MSSHLFKIKTKLRRFFNDYFGFNRPASYPFISGDGFRSISNFILDQFTSFNPTDINYGDIIFVRTDFLNYFFNQVHPKIKNPYVLVSHNEDSSANDMFEKFIDDKILHWYAQNLTFKNNKVTVLPIGVQNFTTGPEENFINLYFKIPQTDPEKKTKILFGFNLHPKIPERAEALEALSKSDISEKIEKKRFEYYENLTQYKFIASPTGGGIDCHRTWEALYFKVIPILIRSSFSEQIYDLGFPILIIERWSDILSLTKEDLDSFYEKESPKFHNERLYLDYWYNSFSKFRNLIK